MQWDDSTVMVGAACAVDDVCYPPSVFVIVAVFVFVTKTMLQLATQIDDLRSCD